MTSVRYVADGGTDKQGFIKCVAELPSRLDAASQECRGDNIARYGIVLDEETAGGKSYANDAVGISNVGSAVKKYNWRMPAICYGKDMRLWNFGFCGYSNHDSFLSPQG